jgi:tRNA(Ile2) C34 agmatinyltransferase TiaS
MPFKCVLDTKIREFQYKILNRIVFTNSLLHKIGKKESPLCPFCSSEEETLGQLFFRCMVVESFWTSLQNCIAHHDLYR